MPSSPLDGKQGRTTSGVACHHHLWAAQMIKRHRAGHAIIAHGRQTRLNDVRRDMPSPPLNSTHDRTTSGVACHHHLWAAHMIERRRAWHAIIAFGQHKRSNDVARGMTSPPLDYMHGQTMSGMELHHHPRTAHSVERRRAWHTIIAFGSTHDQITSGVACHHRLWAAHKVERR